MQAYTTSFWQVTKCPIAVSLPQDKIIFKWEKIDFMQHTEKLKKVIKML